MAEVLDAHAVEELSRLATQRRTMMNREGEAHLQLQQSIEAVATELIWVTYVTATTLQKLTQDGAN
eukprot:9774576-Prorocentrum_lima.AAC.1